MATEIAIVSRQIQQYFSTFAVYMETKYENFRTLVTSNKVQIHKFSLKH